MMRQTTTVNRQNNNFFYKYFFHICEMEQYIYLYTDKYNNDVEKVRK